MRLRTLLAVVTACAAVLAVVPAQAGKTIAVRYYEASGPFARRQAGDPTCQGRRPPCTLSKDGRVEAGGVVFDPIGGKKATTWVKVRIYDEYDAAGASRFSLCQDMNGDGGCGEEAEREPSYDGCSPESPRMRVSTKRPITVYVATAWGCPVYLVPDAATRPATATTGRIVLSYA